MTQRHAHHITESKLAVRSVLLDRLVCVAEHVWNVERTKKLDNADLL